MNRETFEKQKSFASERVPSMKRRCLDRDYSQRGLYMVTLVVEGRRRLFGNVAGRSDGQQGTPEAPRMELSELGEAVYRCWNTITKFYPEAQPLKLQMVPDHLHGILFVKKPMEGRTRGDIIKGFKAGCNKEYRRLAEAGCVATVLQHTGQGHKQEAEQGPRAEPEQGPATKTEQGPATKPEQGSGTEPEQGPGTEPEQGPRIDPEQKQLQRHTGHERGFLFERGYNDKLLLHEGQLQHWNDYLADNPRRLLAKREHPDLFRVRFGLEVAGQTFAALGNQFLLDRPFKLQVQCSRSLTPADIEAAKTHFLTEARQGAVLVSPAISEGEKAVMRSAMDVGLPLIILSPNSLTPLSKPGGPFIEACSRGDLLILAPWPDRSTTKDLTRAECLTLNSITKNICTI